MSVSSASTDNLRSSTSNNKSSVSLTNSAPCKRNKRGKHAPAKTLREKALIIAEVESGMKQSDVCRKHDLKRSTLCGWLVNKNQIKGAFKANASILDSRRVRGTSNDVLDRDLIRWYRQMSDEGVTVSRGMIYLEASRISENLGTGTVAHTWLDRWKNRHGVQQKARKITAMSGANSQQEISFSSPQVMDDEASGLTAEDKASGDIQENKFNFINQLKDAANAANKHGYRVAVLAVREDGEDFAFANSALPQKIKLKYMSAFKQLVKELKESQDETHSLADKTQNEAPSPMHDESDDCSTFWYPSEMDNTAEDDKKTLSQAISSPQPSDNNHQQDDSEPLLSLVQNQTVKLEPTHCSHLNTPPSDNEVRVEVTLPHPNPTDKSSKVKQSHRAEIDRRHVSEPWANLSVHKPIKMEILICPVCKYLTSDESEFDVHMTEYHDKDSDLHMRIQQDNYEVIDKTGQT